MEFYSYVVAIGLLVVIVGFVYLLTTLSDIASSLRKIANKK